VAFRFLNVLALNIAEKILITKNLSKHDKRGITGIVFLMYY
jgi:hypothetical protein